jgi:hypothetical protein
VPGTPVTPTDEQNTKGAAYLGKEWSKVIG